MEHDFGRLIPSSLDTYKHSSTDTFSVRVGIIQTEDQQVCCRHVDQIEHLLENNEGTTHHQIASLFQLLIYCCLLLKSLKSTDQPLPSCEVSEQSTRDS